ncbi:NAD(P)-dependent alcohol dehydrogenase [Streptomyces sp. NPDC048484]|uniref:NAD(P)-dependent alcohol dehydrogenase n=1 Tax=Streptomyces sp. NPDC048484 TaxID=3155146 RepID=UPI0034399B55
MRIRAAVLKEVGGPFEVADVDLAEPQDDEVLVRVVASGICHTDLMVRDLGFSPAPPVVLGHEGSGVVERVGAGVREVAPGDHVVLSYSSCRRCLMCRQGAPFHCVEFAGRNFSGVRCDGSSTLSVLDVPVGGRFFGQSSFATHALVTQDSVVTVPDSLPLELLGPLGCGVQTGAGAVLNVLRPPAGSSLVIFGAGAVGLSALLSAKAVGCARVVVVDLRPRRLALAEELGAHHTVDAGGTDTVERIAEITAGGADFSVEATGVPSVLGQAVRVLAPGGTCALVGAAPPGTEAAIDMSHLLWGRRIQGVVEGAGVPQIFIPRLIAMWQQGIFPFHRLIETYPFASMDEAVADAEKGVVIKPVLTM